VLLLAAGIALALPGLAFADTAAPAADPSADTTSADATATAGAPGGGTAPDPAATTPTTPPAPPAPPADPGTTAAGSSEPVTPPAPPAPAPEPTPAPTPAEPAPPPAPTLATATTDGAPVACTPNAATEAAAAPETVCPALVLVETPDPAPAAPAPEPQQPAQQAPAQPHQQPVLAPATETIVTPVLSGDAESTPVLAPLHGGPADEVAPEPSLALAPAKPKPAPPTLAEERSAPVLTVEPPAPVLAVAPDGLPEVRLVPSPTMVDRTPPAVLRRAALEPLLQHPAIAPTAVVAAGAEPDGSASESDGGLVSTGGDEPLPLFPPQDPSENPTGLGAPSSGGGAHGATGVVAILTALLLLFVPRIVRRLRPPSSPAPLVGFRVVLERPG
jgi:hypothetical protein